MIISRTPLRISFVGGGSDMADFYKHHYGAVISTTIDKYIYINVNQKFDDQIRLSYSKTEMVDSPDELQHELVREILKSLKVHKGIEITSISDIPSSGTGLGSSSAYTIGVINALNAHLGKFSSKEYLADLACDIEINKCNKPIGKQDQYASAYGGFNYIRFNADGTVDVEPVVCPAGTMEKLQENLLMLYTGTTRSADSILKNQRDNVASKDDKKEVLKQMVALAEQMREDLSNGKLNKFGELLDQNWVLKCSLSNGISNPEIDKWYKTAKKHGALGGKILGAGGGGFLLVYAKKADQPNIIKALPKLKAKQFAFSPNGSQIIFSC